MSNRIVRSRRAVAAGLALLASSWIPQAMAEMSCTVQITNTEAGFIVTIGGGHGTLTCDGKSHALRIGGLTVGGAGLAKASFSGTVSNLDKLEDFAGTFTGGTASVTTVAGGASMTITNEKGVKLDLTASTAGADAKLGAGGLKIRFE